MPNPASLPPLWLRDNCGCADCRDPRNGQKLFQITDLPEGLAVAAENPAAVDTAGISVRALRYGAVMICGVLVGLAGVYLVLSQEAYFQPHMSAGRGFIALAALVFAKWRPWPALATCLLFGFLDAVAIRMQGVELPVIGPVPVQAIEALPYILTVVLLAGFIGKAIPPKASGIPYVKER